MLLRDLDSGFTIVEVMIVMAITIILFASAANLVNGRQNQAEFTQATGNIQALIQLQADDVINGSYTSNVGSFRCTPGSSNVGIQLGGSDSQGQHLGCIFLGKLIQFGVLNSSAPASSNSIFYTYSVVGSQCASGDSVEQSSGNLCVFSTSITSAEPTINSYLAYQHSLINGLKVSQMYYNNNPKNITANVAFLQSLASYDTSGASELASGSQQIQLWTVTNVPQGLDSNNVITNVNNASGTSDWTQVSQIDICFASGTTPQSELLEIGGQGSQLSLTTKMYEGSSC